MCEVVSPFLVELPLRKHLKKSAIGRWGWGSPNVRGGIDRGALCCHTRVCRSCTFVEAYVSMGWDRIVREGAGFM